MRGLCKFFNEKKGWGFLESPEGESYFVHFTEILGSGYKSLDAGETVTFDTEATDKGTRAINVKREDSTDGLPLEDADQEPDEKIFSGSTQ